MRWYRNQNHTAHWLFALLLSAEIWATPEREVPPFVTTAVTEQRQAGTENYPPAEFEPILIFSATGAEQAIDKAPAVASVITAAEIRNMGATDLDEVLETVPGLHVARRVFGYNPI